METWLESWPRIGIPRNRLSQLKEIGYQSGRRLSTSNLYSCLHKVYFSFETKSLILKQLLPTHQSLEKVRRQCRSREVEMKDVRMSREDSVSEDCWRSWWTESLGRSSPPREHWRCSTCRDQLDWSWRWGSSWHQHPSTCTSWWWTSGLCMTRSSSGYQSMGWQSATAPGTTDCGYRIAHWEMAGGGLVEVNM